MIATQALRVIVIGEPQSLGGYVQLATYSCHNETSQTQDSF